MTTFYPPYIMDSENDSSDLLPTILAAVPPELVHHIFTFTTSEHASAIGFFDLAASLVPSMTTSPLTRPTNPLLWAIWKGDLPMLRHLLHTKELSNLSQQLATSFNLPLPWYISEAPPRSYMFLHTVVEAQNPLAGAKPDKELEDVAPIHAVMKTWASREEDVALLEFLWRSNFARRNEKITWADWDVVVEKRRMELLKTAMAKERFRACEDLLLLAVLKANWIEALVYLYETCGLRFTTWRWPECNVFNLLYHNCLPIANLLSSLFVLPRDMCGPCHDRWLPRIGYWGLVAALEYHETDASFHDSEGDTLPETLRKPELRPKLEQITRCATRQGKTEIVRYVAKCMPEYREGTWVIYEALAKNDLEMVKFIFERYKYMPEQMGIWRTRAALNKVVATGESILPLVRVLHQYPKLRGNLLSRPLLQKAAVMGGDVELLWYALGGGSDIPLSERDAEMWRIMALGQGVNAVVEVLDLYLERIHEQSVEGEEVMKL